MGKKIFVSTLFSISIVAIVTAITFIQMPKQFENKLKPPVITDVEVVKQEQSAPPCIDVACAEAALPEPMGEITPDFERGFCYAAQIAAGMPFSGAVIVGKHTFNCPTVPE